MGRGTEVSQRYRVVVPYTTLHPVTKSVLDSFELRDVAYMDVSADTDAYRRLLRDLWNEQTTVVMVEHDIVPWPGAIEELAGCMGLWCSCAYRLGGGYGVYHGFGCTKISADLMRLVPHVWDEPGSWDVLDQRLWFAAREAGQEPHPHRPPVIHLGRSAEEARV